MNGHILVAGQTLSGKTFLAKQLVANYKAKGVPVAVLDPLADPEWNADFETTNQAEFLDYAKENESHLLVIDEGGQSIGRYNQAMEWVATMSRHWGHRSVIITQSPKQIPTTVRGQCTTVYLFRVTPPNSKVMFEEYGAEEFKEAHKLPKYYFFKYTAFSPTKRLTLKTKGEK
jgi:DNA helicase HerA-like ATPase